MLVKEEYVLSEIVKHTNNAVIVTDLQQKILYTNQGFSKITGYDSEEVRGKNPGKILQGPETNRRTILRISEKLKKFERVNETILNYSKTGDKYWLQLDIYPLFDEEDRPTHFMAIESVVTDMKLKELVVKEQALRIRENITYAKTLQDTLFRKSDKGQTLFQDHFILDLPKDEVGGDFYLFDEIQNQKIVLVGDCTGHGVSGAIMTAMCLSVITELLARYKTLSPAMILNKANERFSMMMKNGSSTVKDGMEATLVFIDESKKILRFASAKQLIYLMHPEKEIAAKGLRRKNEVEENYELVDETIEFAEGSMLYLASDGYRDQLSAQSGKRLGSKKIMELLAGIFQESCQDQKDAMESALTEWGSGEEQTDDVLLIGLRL